MHPDQRLELHRDKGVPAFRPYAHEVMKKGRRVHGRYYDQALVNRANNLPGSWEPKLRDCVEFERPEPWHVNRYEGSLWESESEIARREYWEADDVADEVPPVKQGAEHVHVPSASVKPEEGWYGVETETEGGEDTQHRDTRVEIKKEEVKKEEFDGPIDWTTWGDDGGDFVKKEEK